MALAYYFGAGVERDAYFSAMAVPTYMTSLFVGSVTITFLPFLVDFKRKYAETELAEFVSGSIGFCLVLLTIFALGGYLASNLIVHLVAPGFDGSQLILTRELFGVLIFTVIFQSLASFMSVFHHIESRFLLPAIGPIMIPITALTFVLLFNGYGIKSLAWGTLLGSVLSLLIVLPLGLRNVKIANLFYFINTDTRKLLSLSLPLFVSGVFYRLTTISERIIGSRLPAGSISYLGYGSQLYMLLAAIASGSIVTTFYPIMSSAWSEGNRDEFSKLLVRGISLILLITLPIASIFIAIGNPIIEILFQRGAFDSSTTIAVAKTLSLMMGAFIFGSLGNIIFKVYYIANKTLEISVIAVIEVIIYGLCGYALSLKYSYLGLAFALTLSTGFTVLVSVILLVRWKYFALNNLFSDTLKLIAASLLCGLASYFIYYSLTAINIILSVMVSSLIGILLYIIASIHILKISDSININKFLKNILKRVIIK